MRQAPARLSGLFAALSLLLGLAVAVVSPAALAEPPIPPLTGRVVDTAHVLSPSTISFLTSKLQTFEQQTTNQLVVVTLPDMKGYQIEDWGLALLRGWGIGQKGRNNGVVLVVAPNDRQLRIEVGYGLEGDLPDATAHDIIQSEIVPRFKAGDIDGGVTAGVDAIMAAVGGTYKPTPQSLLGRNWISNVIGSTGTVFFWVFIVFIFIIHRFNPDPTGSRWSGGSSDSGSSGGSSGGGGFSGGGGSGGGGGASGRW